MSAAGQYNEIVTIYSLLTVKSDFGDERDEYVYSFKTRAKIVHNGGNKSAASDEVFYTSNKLFVLHYYCLDKIKETDYIIWNDKKYFITNIDPNRKYQEIYIESSLVNE